MSAQLKSCAAPHQSLDSLSAQLMPSGMLGLGCVGWAAAAVAGPAAAAVIGPAAAAALDKPTCTLVTLIGATGPVTTGSHHGESPRGVTTGSHHGESPRGVTTGSHHGE
jgi:hypothetical protein